MQRSTQTPKLTQARFLSVAMIIVFVIAVGGTALVNLSYFKKAAVAAGPNTVGEAGKVFFAKRVQHGDSTFLDGREPPYYPSVHGALFHAVVGMAGRVAGATPIALYYIGRSISIAATIGALIVAGLMLRQLRVGWIWVATTCIVFFAVRPVVGHTVSYRPDHWVLGFSILTCYLLMTRGDRWWTLGLAAIFPVVAFFMKATGIAILIATLVVLLVNRRWRSAAIYAAVSVFVLLATIILVNLASGGAFVSGLRTGVNVPFTFALVLRSLDVPQLWLPLIVPVFLLFLPVAPDDRRSDKRNVIIVFWLVTLVYGMISAARLGSNSYYYVESFTYALVLTVSWIADEWQSSTKPSAGSSSAIAVLIVLFSVQTLSEGIRYRQNPITDPALMETLLFGDDRNVIAREVNNRGMRCFSDDPGLNVLFNDPMIIDPMVQSHLIVGGSLDMNTMVDPVVQRAYDLIVLTRRRWHYHDTPHLPTEFIEAVEQHYAAIDNGTLYLKLEPRPPS